MRLIDRVRDILLKPQATWPAIAAEPGDTASIYRSYVIYLAAIPALASFIGLTLIGSGGGGLTLRMPLAAGLAQMVVGYGLSLAAVFVLAWVADLLAPSFGGTQDRTRALKLIAYGSTAGFLGGGFALVPALAVLGLPAALYSIYLIYTGLPVLMRCPPGKAPVYTAVLTGCGVIAMAVMSFAASFAIPWPAGMAMRPGGELAIETPRGKLTVDPAAMEASARRLEETARRVTQAHAEAASSSLTARQSMVESLSGIAGMPAKAPAPIDSQRLKALLPETLGDMKRTSFEIKGGPAMGLGSSTSTAEARYADGQRQLRLSIADRRGLPRLASLAAWGGVLMERETERDVEKVYQDGGRTLREAYRKDGSRSEWGVLLENGVLVQATGRGLDQAGLKRLVGEIDLAELSALK